MEKDASEHPGSGWQFLSSLDWRMILSVVLWLIVVLLMKWDAKPFRVYLIAAYCIFYMPSPANNGHFVPGYILIQSLGCETARIGGIPRHWRALRRKTWNSTLISASSPATR